MNKNAKAKADRLVKTPKNRQKEKKTINFMK